MRVLKVRPLALFLLAVILAAQALLFSSHSDSYSFDRDQASSTELSLGIGTPIAIRTEAGVTTPTIRWATLFLNVAASLALAICLAEVAVKATRLRRPAVVYFSIAVGMVVFAFIASISISRAYWGYWFQRPALPHAINKITKITAVIPVATVTNAAGERAMVPDEIASLTKALSNVTDPYYCLSQRILVELRRKNLLPAVHQSSLSGLPELYPLIKSTGILARPDEGYVDSDILRGFVVDGFDALGERLVFIGVTGWYVANDHRPYYELLFRAPDVDSALKFASSQRFFYDVAGIEGVEWYAIWPYFSIIAIIVGLIIFTVAAGIWNLVRRSHPDRLHPGSLNSTCDL
jgi:hypothetical protein